MEPLNEGKPFLKGKELSARMTALAGKIVEEHALAKGAWQSALEHARKAGEWLIEAKWRTGHRTKWGRWKRHLAKEQGISERTMSQYMQIARHWDDARIDAARADGINIDSISKFLQALRGRAPAPGRATTTELDTSRQRIRKEFAAWLRTLDAHEVRVLDATLDEWLAVANANLRERVCGNDGGPYYHHRDEWQRERDAKAEQPREPNGGNTQRNAAAVAAADMRRAVTDRRDELWIRGNAEPSRPTRRRERRPRRRKRRAATTLSNG